MREIKFRAWDEERNTMLVEFDVDSETGQVSSSFFDRVTIYQAILMQYTGLKDKHGMEVYEGDIVVWDVSGLRHRAEIHYSIRWAQWFKGSTPLVYGTPDELEVIGNVHENPELVKQDSMQS